MLFNVTPLGNIPMTTRAPWDTAPASRQYLENVLLPGLADQQPVLFVGVADFTEHYHELVGSNAEFTTIDIQAVARGAKPDIVTDVTSDSFVDEMHSRGLSFQSVVFNGILGYGVDDPESARRSFANLHAVLRPGGTLLIGWNEWACDRDDLIAMLQAAGFSINTIEGQQAYGGDGSWDNETRVSWLKRKRRKLKNMLGMKTNPLPRPRRHHYLLASGGSAACRSAA